MLDCEPGDHVWVSGVVDNPVPVPSTTPGLTYIVARLCAGGDDMVRIVSLRENVLLTDAKLVVVAGYVEHPTDGSPPVVIVTSMKPAGHDGGFA